MARAGGSPKGTALAQGDRAVAIAGDVTNSVIVTGDHATFEVQLGPESGALLELLKKSQEPTKRLRPTPLDGRPPLFPDRLDREAEAATVLDPGEPPRAVNLYGDSGIGKSYVLALVANDPATRALPGGVVSLLVRSLPLQDILQACFEEFWECVPPFKATDAQIRRDLRDRQALVLVDSLELLPDEAQALVQAAPHCRFLLASREQSLWDGKAVELAGLPEADALALFEQELGRALREAERGEATAACRLLRGHPLKIRQTAASARRGERPLADIVAELASAAGSRRPLLESASPEEERVLRALALLGGASVGEERLGELSGVPSVSQVAARLTDARLVRSHSPRYSVDAALAEEIGGLWPLDQDGERALASITNWAEKHRLEPGKLAEELDALLALFRRAARRPGFETRVIRLGRAIDIALAWSRRFGAWGEVLAEVHRSAIQLGDRSAEAWALHELGVHEICLGRVRLGRQQLRRSVRIRRALGDQAAAAAGEHNLEVAAPRIAFLGPLRVLPFAMLPLVVLALVLASGGGAAAWFLSHNRHHYPPVATGSTSTSSTTTKPAQRRQLSVRIDGRGTVTSSPLGIDCPGRCRFGFRHGTLVTLAAQADPGSKFLGWSAGSCPGIRPCHVMMKRRYHVSAKFELAPATSTTSQTTTQTAPTTTAPTTTAPTTTKPTTSSAPTTTTQTITQATTTVPPAPPDVAIIDPTNGKRYCATDSDRAGSYYPVVFTASASDPNSPPRSLTYQWTESINGGGAQVASDALAPTLRLYLVGKTETTYDLTLTVSNGAASQSMQVRIYIENAGSSYCIK